MTTTAYARPSTLADALTLLERPGAVALAGGTRLNGSPSDDVVEMVDLQALGLERIEPEGAGSLRIGAMATLQALVDTAPAPETVREAARRELPSTLRAQATVGGCVATGRSESELLAALLVHEAAVHLRTRETTEVIPLEEVLAGLPVAPGKLVLGLTIRTSGRSATSRTARTPADGAIVAACARTTITGPRIALAGVAGTPVLVHAGDEINPIGDFRGSTVYRRALATVLMARALEAIS